MIEIRSSTICAVVERPDQHFGDDFVWCLFSSRSPGFLRWAQTQLRLRNYFSSETPFGRLSFDVVHHKVRGSYNSRSIWLTITKFNQTTRPAYVPQSHRIWHHSIISGWKFERKTSKMPLPMHWSRISGKRFNPGSPNLLGQSGSL